MNVRLTRLMSPAMIVACVALVVALGGVSYAAGVLPANSVGAKQIKKRAVTLRKISPAARTALRGQRGEKGDPGPAGPAGPQGVKGDSGLTHVHVVKAIETLAVDEGRFVKANCPPGERATGGGVDAGREGVVTRTNGPQTFADPTPVGWVGGFANRSGQATQVAVIAICTT